MEKKKKKNAFGWFQVFKGDPKTNEEIFNHIMNDHPNSEANNNGGETSASDGAMAEAYKDMIEHPETMLEVMRALRELKD